MGRKSKKQLLNESLGLQNDSVVIDDSDFAEEIEKHVKKSIINSEIDLIENDVLKESEDIVYRYFYIYEMELGNPRFHKGGLIYRFKSEVEAKKFYFKFQLSGNWNLVTGFYLKNNVIRRHLKKATD